MNSCCIFSSMWLDTNVQYYIWTDCFLWSLGGVTWYVAVWRYGSQSIFAEEQECRDEARLDSLTSGWLMEQIVLTTLCYLLTFRDIWQWERDGESDYEHMSEGEREGERKRGSKGYWNNSFVNNWWVNGWMNKWVTVNERKKGREKAKEGWSLVLLKERVGELSPLWPLSSNFHKTALWENRLYSCNSHKTYGQLQILVSVAMSFPTEQCHLPHSQITSAEWSTDQQ